MWLNCCFCGQRDSKLYSSYSALVLCRITNRLKMGRRRRPTPTTLCRGNNSEKRVLSCDTTTFLSRVSQVSQGNPVFGKTLSTLQSNVSVAKDVWEGALSVLSNELRSSSEFENVHILIVCQTYLQMSQTAHLLWVYRAKNLKKSISE